MDEELKKEIKKQMLEQRINHHSSRDKEIYEAEFNLSEAWAYINDAGPHLYVAVLLKSTPEEDEVVMRLKGAYDRIQEALDEIEDLLPTFRGHDHRQDQRLSRAVCRRH